MRMPVTTAWVTTTVLPLRTYAATTAAAITARTMPIRTQGTRAHRAGPVDSRVPGSSITGAWVIGLLEPRVDRLSLCALLGVDLHDHSVLDLHEDREGVDVLARLVELDRAVASDVRGHLVLGDRVADLLTVGLAGALESGGEHVHRVIRQH